MNSSFKTGALLVFLWPLSLMAQSTPVGGTFATNAVWSPAMGTILVYSNVVVTANATLTIQAGTTVKLTNGLSISAQAGCTIDIEGTASQPVLFVPMVGNNTWGTVSASGNNSFLTVRHAEIAYGGINLGSQATGLIEDTYVHDVFSAIVGNSARFVTVRRSHVKNYSETIYNSGTVILAEDSLFENMTAANSDALEIQGGPTGSIIRRCTFRHSSGGNSDCLDFNGSTGVLVQDCLIYDFNDKGVSIGTATTATDPPSKGIVVTNCFIYNVDSCVAVKDFSTAAIFNNTFAYSLYGLRAYEKYAPYNLSTGGGRFTNGYNNLIWGNTNFINTLSNGSVLQITYSDVQSNWPGTGNITSNPLFLRPTQLDLRLATNSPAAKTGYLGADMGATFPVGAPMALSHPRFESVVQTGDIVILSFWVDSEKSYSLQYSDALVGGSWVALTNFSTRPLPVLMNITNGPPSGTSRFYRLITPQQP